MKLAILSESLADEASLRILVDAVVRKKTIPPQIPSLRIAGWSGVPGIIPTVLMHLHYQTDVDGLVVVADSDDSPPHDVSHESQPLPDCRYCRIQEAIAETKKKLKPIQGRPRVNVAVGIAIPALEAWWLCGTNPHYAEAPAIRRVATESLLHMRKELKLKLYGTIRPTLEIEMMRMCEAARRVTDDLEELERAFPIGIGLLRQQLRLW